MASKFVLIRQAGDSPAATSTCSSEALTAGYFSEANFKAWGNVSGADCARRPVVAAMQAATTHSVSLLNMSLSSCDRSAGTQGAESAGDPAPGISADQRMRGAVWERIVVADTMSSLIVFVVGLWCYTRNDVMLPHAGVRS